MSSELSAKEKNRNYNRKKYQMAKARKLGIIYHILDSEETIRRLIDDHEKEKAEIQRYHDEEAGKSIAIKQEGATVEQFYKIKKEYELDKDIEWTRKLKGDADSAEIPSHSYKRDMIESGISPLLFDIVTPKSKVVVMPSDSDKHLTYEQKKEKEKSSWNF